MRRVSLEGAAAEGSPLQQAINAGDSAAMLQQLHQLQGVAGLSGIKHLYQQLHALQQAVQTDDGAAIASYFESLQQTWAEVSS